MYQVTRQIKEKSDFKNIHLEAHTYIWGREPYILMVWDIIYYAMSFYLVPQYNFFVLNLADFTLTVQNRHCFKNSFVISVSKYDLSFQLKQPRGISLHLHAHWEVYNTLFKSSGN